MWGLGLLNYTVNPVSSIKLCCWNIVLKLIVACYCIETEIDLMYVVVLCIWCEFGWRNTESGGGGLRFGGGGLRCFVGLMA